MAGWGGARNGGLARVAALGGAVAMVAATLGGCGGPSGSPAATLSRFLSAWNRNDGAAMASLVDRPAPGFGATLGSYTAGLQATSAVHRAGKVTSQAGHRTAQVSSTYQLPKVGPWTVTTTAELVERSGRWKVLWSPSIVAPGLQPGQHLEADYSWAPRAAILGAGGTPLTGDADQVDVGVEGSRIKDPAALTQVLEAAGAPASTVSSALAAAAAHPTFFEPVLELSDAAYAALGGNGGNLHATPGTVFRHVTVRAAVTPGLASGLVGSVGPITADELKKLGPPYSSSSVVGQTGLEAAYEQQLAGQPGATVKVVAGTGRASATLASLPPKPGTPVTTGVDPAIQRAAEAALASLGPAQAPVPAGTNQGNAVALVAVSVDKDQILAAANLAEASSFDPALAGEFPPGSTFKLVTSSALFGAGLGPSSPASCPPSATVDGENFHNAEGDQPVATLAQAFTESCNTAFVQLATAHLQPSSLPTAAAEFGLGTPFRMGLPAFSGKVPTPKDNADLAAASIGQDSVLVSPLAMAMVAAAVGSGTAHLPRLVAGTPDDSDPGRPLPTAVVDQLRPMMASVVTAGTAANTGLPAGTYAKTGTAEYGSGPKLPVDAWLVGYHANVAFAMVVQNSKADGGPTDGPVVARFLSALPVPGG